MKVTVSPVSMFLSATQIVSVAPPWNSNPAADVANSWYLFLLPSARYLSDLSIRRPGLPSPSTSGTGPGGGLVDVREEVGHPSLSR